MNIVLLGGITRPKRLIGVRLRESAALLATVKAVGLSFKSLRFGGQYEVVNDDGYIAKPWPPIANEFLRRIERMGSSAGCVLRSLLAATKLPTRDIRTKSG